MFSKKEKMIQELRRELIDCKMKIEEEKYKISRLKVDNERLREIVKMLTEKMSNGNKGQLELLNSAVKGVMAGVSADELLWTLGDVDEYFTADKEG